MSERIGTRQDRPIDPWRHRLAAGLVGVRARQTIPDSPLARTDASVPPGTRGELLDVLPHDGGQGLLVVAFQGGGVLLCGPEEVAPSLRMPI